jgi:hypothetical protein
MRIRVERKDSAVRIVGRQVSVQLYPLATGRVNIAVIAHPPATGWSRDVHCMGDDTPHVAAEDVMVQGDTLTCMSPTTQALGARFRTGFVVELDPGMGAIIAKTLPRMFRIAELIRELSEHARRFQQRDPAPAEHHAIARAVSAAVLDGHDFTTWLHVELELLHNPTDAAAMALVAPLTVETILDRIAEARAAAG